MAQDSNYWIKPPFQQLLKNITEQKCLPFVGPEVCQPWIPLGKDIAIKWAREYHYPLRDSYQLSRVAQFLTIQYDDSVTKDKLKDELETKKPPNFATDEFKNEPLAILADLKLPIYITTNYDHFLEEALRNKGKEPISDFCRWNEDLSEYAIDNKINSNLYSKNPEWKITPANPLVYHLLGDMHHPKSMVLTEKDFIDFVIFLNKENETKVLPLEIRKKINSEHLLFIGYSLYDISFSVIFQTVINSGKANRSSFGISVQLMSLNGDSNMQVDNDTARDYLEEYTKQMFKLYVFPGNSKKFSEELRLQLDRFASLSA
jgi:SIR2-like domain